MTSYYAEVPYDEAFNWTELELPEDDGGFTMYWYGVPNPETGMNPATCIWRSRKHAVTANSRPHHIRAMTLAAASYGTYTLERYKQRKSRGERGVTIEPFDGTEVG